MELALTERDKYDTLYRARPSYGDFCHDRAVLDFILDLDFEDVLDVGCGGGQFAAFMVEHGKKARGIDISSEAVKIAQIRFPEARFRRGDITNIPMNHVFGLITSFDVLEHVPEDQVDLAIQQLAEHTSAYAVASITFHRDVLDGFQLHLTVKPEDWWMNKLLTRFKWVRVIERKAKDRGAYFHMSY